MPEQTESQTVLTYWLLPAQPAREFFRETIGRLAAECDAPLFAPHLTLAIGPDSVAQAQRILAGLTASRIELHAKGIHFTSKFTKTLFIRFDSSSALDQLRDSLGLEAGDRPFDPHVSLLYKSLPEEKQSQLAVAISMPFRTVWFDMLQVVRCRIPVATSADVAAWETVGTRRLVAL